MKWKTLLLSLICITNVVHAQSNPDQCFNTDWRLVSYETVARGKTVIYVPPTDYNLTATNLACVTAIQVLKHRKKMPKRMLVGLITADYRKAFLAQWSFPDKRFTIFEVNIDKKEFLTKGMFISYPEPLERLREIMAVKRFPTKEELPSHLQHRFKVNYVPTSLMQLRVIAQGETNDRY